MSDNVKKKVVGDPFLKRKCESLDDDVTCLSKLAVDSN